MFFFCSKMLYPKMWARAMHFPMISVWFSVWGENYRHKAIDRPENSTKIWEEKQTKKTNWVVRRCCVPKCVHVPVISLSFWSRQKQNHKLRKSTTTTLTTTSITTLSTISSTTIFLLRAVLQVLLPCGRPLVSVLFLLRVGIRSRTKCLSSHGWKGFCPKTYNSLIKNHVPKTSTKMVCP